MIPAAFDYIRVATLADAIRMLADKGPEAKLLAGGHTLIPALKLRLASPSLLIDIGRIAELKKIEIADSVRIGALCTHAQILASPTLHDLYPVLREAANLIADPLVRNRGTIGGSLANADPAADWPAVVIALGAEIELVGPEGKRRMRARDFFVDMMATALAPQEIITAIQLPLPEPGSRAAYYKVRHPASGYAVVGVAIMAIVEAGTVSAATIGITGAARRAFEASEAGRCLTGKTPSREVVAQAASLVSTRSDFLDDAYASASYRKHVVRVGTERLLSRLLL